MIWTLVSFAPLVVVSVAPAVRVEVRVVPYPNGGVPPGELVLRGVDTSSEETRRSPLASSMPLDLPRGSSWEVTSDAPGFWAQPRFLYAGETQSLLLSLWQLATVKFPYTGPSQVSTRPSQAWARFSGHGPEAGDVSGQVQCTVEQEPFLCALPVTRVDVLLRIAGFASEPF